MFCTDPITRTAQKMHQCTYCGEMIITGEKYEYWKSVDDSWFENKLHPECANDFYTHGDGEYSVCSNERPKELT